MTFKGDVEIASIKGDGQPGFDSLTLQATGQVHLTGNVGGGGLHDVSILAGGIKIDPDVVFSTRDVAAGADPHSANSIGNSGNLTLTAPQILIGKGAALLAQGNAGFQSGDIQLTATQTTDLTWSLGNPVAGFQLNQSQAQIDIGQNAMLEGLDVSVLVKASTTKHASLNSDLDPATNPSLERSISFNGSTAVNGNAAAADSEAQATLVLESGVDVTADLGIILKADALADAEISTSGKFAGITYGRTAPTATVTVEGGAHLHAGRTVGVVADASDTIAVNTKVPVLGDAGNLSLSLAESDSTAMVDVQSGAEVQAQSAGFAAQNTTTAINKAIAEGPTAGNGAVQVLGAYRSHTSAHEAGDVTTSGKVTVAASAQENLGGLASGSLALGAGTPGSVVNTLIDDTTTATIDDGATVQAGSVLVQAQDMTTISDLAGALAPAAVAGIGGSFDGGHIKKDTRASIENHARVAANQDAMVLALSEEDILSLSANLSFSGAAAIAGAADIFSLPVTTTATIASGAVVTAPGSVIVNADDNTNVNCIAGVASGAGNSAAAGGSAGFVVLNKNTEAAVDSGAQVTALGEAPAQTIENGTFEVSYQSDPALIPGMIVAGLLDVIGFVFDNPIRTAIQKDFNFQGDYAFLNLTPVSAPPVDPALTKNRTAPPATQAIQGLAVTATSRDKVKTLAVGLASGGILVPEFSGAGLITTNHTEAFIGQDAMVNASRQGAHAQSVLVAAGSDTFFTTLGGGAALSNSSSLGAAGGAFEVALIGNTTEAGIGTDARVNAKGDVTVQAGATEDVLTFGASITAGSGSSLINGDASINLVSIQTATHAFVGDHANVDAGGNLLVSARDDTDLNSVAGAGALGDNSVIGAGVSLPIAVISKETQAFIGKGATVNALGNSAATIDVPDGTVQPSVGTQQIHGLGAEAHSSENVFGLAAAGTSSASLGLAGAGTVSLIDARTGAFVEDGATINPDQADASPLQTVNISAVNEETIFGLPVNVTKGTVALGLGLDLSIVSNDTSAQVLPGATVNAQQDIDVYSLEKIKGDSFIANIGRPDKFGVNTTMSLYSLRGEIVNPLPIPLGPLDVFAKLDTLGATSVQKDIDNLKSGLSTMNLDGVLGDLTQPGGGGLADALGGYDSSLGVSDTTGALSSGTPKAPVGTAVNGPAPNSGTTAVISGAKLQAGRDVVIGASEKSNFALDTVTATEIADAVNQKDSDTIAPSNDRAYVFEHTIANATVTGATITAGRDVSIQGYVKHNATLTSSSGSNFIETTTGAKVLAGSTIKAGHNVNLNAHGDEYDTNFSILPDLDGKQIKTGGNYLTGDIEASSQGESTLTAGTDVNINAVDDATALTVANSMTRFQDSNQSGKLPTLAVAYGANSIAHNVSATVLGGTVTATAGNVEVTATATPLEVAIGLGFAEAEQYLVIGGSIARNTISNTVHAALFGGGTVTAAGEVRVEADDNSTITAIGGNVAIANGKAGVGASLAFDKTINIVSADIAGFDGQSMSVTAPSIVVRAHEHGNVLGVAVGGASASNFTLAGSYVENHSENSISAFVGDHAVLNAAGDIAVQAGDDGKIVATGGQIAAASDGVAIGTSVSANYIQDVVHAYVKSDAPEAPALDAFLTAPTIEVHADNKQQIIAVSAAGSYGSDASAAASVSTNSITGSTIASLDSDPSIKGGRSVSVMATDDASITAVAGSANLSDGKVAAGAAVAENDIGGTTDAHVGNALVSAENLAVQAIDKSSITAVSAAGSYSQGVTATGAVSLNNITNSVTAAVTGSRSTVKATNVLVEAHDSSSIGAVIASAAYGDKVALAGSVTLNEDGSSVSAAIADNANVSGDGIIVRANNEPTIQALAGAVSASSTVAVGDATALNKIHAGSEAKIDTAFVTGGSVTVEGMTNAGIEALSAAGTGASNVGATATQALDEIHNTTNAQIVGMGNVQGTTITVHAGDDSGIKSLSGSAAVGGDLGAAAAVSENHIGNKVHATILDGIVHGKTVDVLASSNSGGEENLTAVAISVGAAGKAALGGSLAVNEIKNDVEARITSLAHVTAGDSITVQASDNPGIRVVAGNGEGAGTLAAGAAVAKNNINSTVEAAIDSDADVSSPVVAVTALTTATSKSASAVGAGAGTVAADAAVALNNIGNQTLAFVEGGAQVKAATDLTIKAKDKSTITSITGAGAGAGTASIAAGVSTNEIANIVTAQADQANLTVGDITLSAAENAHVEALSVGVAAASTVSVTGGVGINDIADTVTSAITNKVDLKAKGDVSVLATDASTVSALTGQAGGALVGLGGAVSFNQIQNHVRAYIDGSQVQAPQGNIFVNATSSQTIEEIAAGGNGGFVGISGNVSVNLLKSDTEAYIHQSEVHAGNSLVINANTYDTLTVIAGQGTGGFVGVGGTVIVNTTENVTRAYIDDESGPNVVSADGNGLAVSVPQWDAVTGVMSEQPVHGLAIVANTVESPGDLPTLTAINGVGGFVGVSGIVTVTTVNDTTEAFISRSQINSAADFGGQVIVRAHADDYLNIVSGGGAGGFVGLGGTVDHTAITGTTRAFISNNDESAHPAGYAPSLVYSKGVEVSTVSHEKIDEHVIGVVGGAVALAGTVSVVDITSHNNAFIHASEVNSKGDLAVLANDSATVNALVGTVVGGAVGAGASVSIDTIKTTVEATAVGATLNALGALTIAADSHETLKPVVAAGSLGALALAGVVSINTIETTTEAQIFSGGNPTTINQDPNFQPGGAHKPGPGQTVTISAADTVLLDTKAGALAGGGAGIGASVEVDAVRDRTAAAVGNGSRIDATGDVSVLAVSDRNLSTNVVAFAGGAVGLSGAVSVLGLGANESDAGTQEFNKTNKNDPNSSLLGQTQNSTKAPSVQIDPLSKQGGSSIAGNATTDAANVDVPNLPADVGMIGSGDKVTAAFIEDGSGRAAPSQIHSGGNVAIQATNTYHVEQLTGSAAGGLVGVGAGIGVATVHNTTQAYLGTYNHVSAKGDVIISATDSDTKPTTLTAVGGAAGGVAIDYNVADLTLDSSTTANVGSHAVVEQGDAVTIAAHQYGEVDATGQGYGVAAVAAAGAVKVEPTLTVTAVAGIADDAVIGSDANRVGSLTVVAGTNDTVQTKVEVGHAAAVGINDGLATTKITPTADAHIGSVPVFADGSVSVAANAFTKATSSVAAVSGGIVAGGAGRSDMTIAGSVNGYVASGADIHAGELLIGAHNTSTVNVTGDAIGAGLADDNAAQAKATVNMSVAATLGGATVYSTGLVAVAASSTVTETLGSGTFGIVGVGAGGSDADAKIMGNVTAAIANGAKVISHGLQVTATSEETAMTDARAVGVGLATADAASATSDIEGDTIAIFGKATAGSDGDILIDAESTRTTHANTGELAVGAGAFGGLVAKATISGAVEADTLPGANVLTFNPGSSFNVTITAHATDGATANATATTGGLIAGSAAEATATVGVDTSANVHGVHMFVTGNTLVAAGATNTADATSVGAAVGLVGAKGQATANTIDNGTTRAYADGDFELHGALTVEAHDADSHAIATTTAAGGGITLGIQTTDAHASMEPAANATDLQVRARLAGKVVARGDVVVRAESSGANVTATANGFNVSGGGSVAASDAIAVLSPTIRASIGDDSTVTGKGNITVEALNSAKGANATASASGGALIGINGALATADAKADVTSALGDSNVTAAGLLLVHSDSTNLTSATGSGVTIGALVGVGDVHATANAGKSTQATVNPGAVLQAGGLEVRAAGTDRGITYVEGTGGGTVTADSTGDTTNVTSAVSATIGDNVAATITGNVLISSEDTIEGDALAKANSAGAVAIGGTTAVVNLKPSVTSTVGKDAHLHADGNVNIEAVANRNAPTNIPGLGRVSGDGYSQARAEGWSATAFVGSQGATAKVFDTPHVYVVIASPDARTGPSIDAGNDVTISTISNVNVDSRVSNGAVGILGVGNGNALGGTSTVNTSLVDVAPGVQINAGHDLTIAAKARHVGNANAYAAGFGGIGVANANSFTDIDYNTKASIEGEAHVTAGNQLTVATSTDSLGEADAKSEGGGVGAETSSNNSAGGPNDQAVGGAMRGVRIGHSFADTDTEIGSGAVLHADVVNLTADVIKTKGSSNATADSGGAAADSHALARVELWDKPDVTVQTGAQVTGTSNVLLRSSVDEVDIDVFALAKSSGLFVSANGILIADTQTDATVHAEPGAVITTHDLQVKSLLGAVNVPFLDLSQSNNKGTFSPGRDIYFNANVNLLSEPSPLLVIDANGNVIKHRNVSWTTTPTSFIVNDIINNAPGSASFVTTNNVLHAGVASISGNKSTFNFIQTLDTVHLENHSTKHLVINNIEVVNRTIIPQITIDVDFDQLLFGPGAGTPLFTFDVKQSFLPTKVEILSLSPLGHPDIYFKGVIDNPIGLTKVRDSAGAILPGNSSAVIVSNTFDIAATKDNVGSVLGRLRLDYVQSAGLDTWANISAGGNVWLDVQALLRDPSFAKFSPNLGIITGKNVDVFLRGALLQTILDPNANLYIKVSETHPTPVTTFTNNHFRPDGALALPPLSVFGIGTKPMDATYFFSKVVADGNLKITGDPARPSKINVQAYTDLTGAGKMDIATNGNIFVEETMGDLPVGLIKTIKGDVTLLADEGSIVDEGDPRAADIIGNNLTLDAAGGIGAANDPLKIISAVGGTGIVNATANDGIYLTQLAGNLTLGQVISKASDVGLETVRGSILNGTADDEVNVEGVNVSLIAHGGSIGTARNDLDVMTSNPTPGSLVATADQGTWIENL
jgi:hypothetical protein